ncbi:MAG: Mor transcription activator family protein [Candidatus Pacebacteria bacterium]|nr:Mor transcription activator family protein [Candidatus Paceibacterota bacterium]
MEEYGKNSEEKSDTIAEIAAILAAELDRLDPDFEYKLAVVEAVTRELRWQFAGQQVYFGKGYDVRNAEIYQKFNGRNHESLAVEYRLSVSRIRSIIDQFRRDSQTRLFE